VRPSVTRGVARLVGSHRANPLVGPASSETRLSPIGGRARPRAKSPRCISNLGVEGFVGLAHPLRVGVRQLAHVAASRLEQSLRSRDHFAPNPITSVRRSHSSSCALATAAPVLPTESRKGRMLASLMRSRRNLRLLLVLVGKLVGVTDDHFPFAAFQSVDLGAAKHPTVGETVSRALHMLEVDGAS
jgi:hypothetical protein